MRGLKQNVALSTICCRSGEELEVGESMLDGVGRDEIPR